MTDHIADRKEFVESLRNLADFFEQHEEIRLPLTTHITVFPNYSESKQQFRDFCRAIGGKIEKQFGDDVMYADKPFGNLFILRFMAYRDAVCERVVVGTKVLPATEERIVPAEPEREVEIVEWRCGSVLAEVAQ